MRLGGVLALLAPASFAFVGHSRSAQPCALVVASDITHTAARSVWLGGLAGLVVVLVGRDVRPVLVAHVLTRFSAMAASSLAAVGITGVLLAWRILGSWGALTGTTYGRVLLIKLGLVGVGVIIATWNRWVLVPRVAQSPTDIRAHAGRLRRTVRAEALVVMAAVAVTGALVNLPPRRPSRHCRRRAA